MNPPTLATGASCTAEILDNENWLESKLVGEAPAEQGVSEWWTAIEKICSDAEFFICKKQRRHNSRQVVVR